MPFEYEESEEDYEVFEEDGESFVTSYVGSDTDIVTGQGFRPAAIALKRCPASTDGAVRILVPPFNCSKNRSSVGSMSKSSEKPLFHVILSDCDERVIEAEWPDSALEPVSTFRDHSAAADG